MDLVIGISAEKIFEEKVIGLKKGDKIIGTSGHIKGLVVVLGDNGRLIEKDLIGRRFLVGWINPGTDYRAFVYVRPGTGWMKV